MAGVDLGSSSLSCNACRLAHKCFRRANNSAPQRPRSQIVGCSSLCATRQGHGSKRALLNATKNRLKRRFYLMAGVDLGSSSLSCNACRLAHKCFRRANNSAPQRPRSQIVGCSSLCATRQGHGSKRALLNATKNRLKRRFYLMAGVTGLGPATFCVTGRRSNQLSYTPSGRVTL